MYNTFRQGVRKIRGSILPYIINFSGWRTKRKIIVIESDDWGSIRMPSREVYEECQKAGYHADQIEYEKYDSLASEEDLEQLFDMLKSFKDIHGNHPVITANALVANPDFEKILESDFKHYFFEPITETFKRYPNHENSFNLWQKGVKEGVFFPQSHGREHLNVSKFMRALNRRDKDAIFAFNHRMPGAMTRGNMSVGHPHIRALEYYDINDKQNKLEIILEGLDMFEEMFGYRSESFIPPNYLWSNDFDEAMSQHGVRFYQGNRKMKEIRPGRKSVIHRRSLGEKNTYKQRYLVRNVLFEPALQKNMKADYVQKCLSDIRASFRMNKPAIICSHRINYVGYLVEENRDRTLSMLNYILKSIQKEWPETEFLNSVQLGNMIANSDK